MSSFISQSFTCEDKSGVSFMKDSEIDELLKKVEDSHTTQKNMENSEKYVNEELTKCQTKGIFLDDNTLKKYTQLISDMNKIVDKYNNKKREEETKRKEETEETKREENAKVGPVGGTNTSGDDRADKPNVVNLTTEEESIIKTKYDKIMENPETSITDHDYNTIQPIQERLIVIIKNHYEKKNECDKLVEEKRKEIQEYKSTISQVKEMSNYQRLILYLFKNSNLLGTVGTDNNKSGIEIVNKSLICVKVYNTLYIVGIRKSDGSIITKIGEFIDFINSSILIDNLFPPENPPTNTPPTNGGAVKGTLNQDEKNKDKMKYLSLFGISADLSDDTHNKHLIEMLDTSDSTSDSTGDIRANLLIYYSDSVDLPLNPKGDAEFPNDTLSMYNTRYLGTMQYEKNTVNVGVITPKILPGYITLFSISSPSIKDGTKRSLVHIFNCKNDEEVINIFNTFCEKYKNPKEYPKIDTDVVNTVDIRIDIDDTQNNGGKRLGSKKIQKNNKTKRKIKRRTKRKSKRKSKKKNRTIKKK